MTDKTPAMPEHRIPDDLLYLCESEREAVRRYANAYALAALQSAQPAEVSDEQKALAEQLKNIANGIRICGVSDRRFVGERLDKIASAILAHHGITQRADGSHQPAKEQ